MAGILSKRAAAVYELPITKKAAKNINCSKKNPGDPIFRLTPDV